MSNLITLGKSLEEQVETAIAQGDGVNVFLFFQYFEKVAKKYKEQTKELAVNYWQENHELPHGFSVKESNRKSYDFSQDPKWQIFKSHLEAREKALKEAAEVKQDYFDIDGEIVPRVPVKNSAVYSFSQKKYERNF